jgi:hypothetical protein
MTPKAYAALKALQRKPKPPRLATGAHVDAKRQQRGMLPRYTEKAKTR